jgi:hypothetical protein
MIFLLAGAPSSNPKANADGSVHEQAIGRVVDGEPSVGLLDCVSNLQGELAVQIRPPFSGLEIFAVSLRRVADQPIDIPQAAEVMQVGCDTGKAYGVVDDGWT